MASLGLYCFPIGHIFGICTTLSWHSGFPIPIQLPYLCGKKGCKPGKGKNIFDYAHSNNSIPFHRWSGNQLPLLAIIINIVSRFKKKFPKHILSNIKRSVLAIIINIISRFRQILMNYIKRSVLQTHFNRSISTTVKTHSWSEIHQNNLDL